MKFPTSIRQLADQFPISAREVPISNFHPPTGGSISDKGFTLIELMVVLSIMAIILGIFTVNLAGQRGARNLNIAQNELVTNIRQLQSYALSSRTISGTQAVQYYVAKFDLSTPDRYTLQAIYNVTTAPQLQDLQTVKFPDGVRVSGLSITPPGGSALTIPSCALIGFRLPYGKIIMSNGCRQNGWSADGTDDYQSIINFINNSPSSNTYGDSAMNISFNYSGQTALTKAVVVKGMSGTVLFQ